MLGWLNGPRRNDRPLVHLNFQSDSEHSGDQVGSSPFKGSTLGSAVENQALNDSSVILRRAFSILDTARNSARNNFHRELWCLGGLGFVVLEEYLSLARLS